MNIENLLQNMYCRWRWRLRIFVCCCHMSLQFAVFVGTEPDACEYERTRLGEAHCRVKAVHAWLHVNFSRHTWLELWQLKCSILIHLARRVLKGERRYFTIRFVSLLEYTCRVYRVSAMMLKFVWTRRKFFLLMNCAKMPNIIDVLTLEHQHHNLRDHLPLVRLSSQTSSQYRFPKYLTLAFYSFSKIKYLQSQWYGVPVFGKQDVLGLLK